MGLGGERPPFPGALAGRGPRSPLRISPLPLLPGCPVPGLQMSPWGPLSSKHNRERAGASPRGAGQTAPVTVHIPPRPALSHPSPSPTPPPLKTQAGSPSQRSSWGWAVPPPPGSLGRGGRGGGEGEAGRLVETKGASLGGKEPLRGLELGTEPGGDSPAEPRSGSFRG